MIEGTEYNRVRRVGFSGTRDGMTLAQKVTVVGLLRALHPDWLHHGDCVGADQDFHYMAEPLGMKVQIHPPSDPELRANLVGDEVMDEKPYLDRNRDIVHAVDVLIATPREATEAKKGGTWYTIRYARRKGTPTIVVWPDGSTSN